MEYSRLVYSTATAPSSQRTVGIGREDSRTTYAREATQEMLHEHRRTKSWIYRPIKPRWK